MREGLLETQRLRLRPLTDDDLPALCAILQDPVAMRAYEHAFSDEEAREWLARQQRRRARDGLGPVSYTHLDVYKRQARLTA